MDFKSIILEALKDGKTVNEIVGAFNDAVDEATTPDMTEVLCSTLVERLNNESAITKDDVGTLAEVWARQTHKDWGKDELNVVRESVTKVLEFSEAALDVLMPLVKKDTKTDYKRNLDDDAKALKEFLESL